MALPTFEEILKATSTNMWLMGLPIERGCPVTPMFFLYFFNILLIAIEEFFFIISRMEADHFLELTALAPCLANGIMCQYKAFAIFLNREKIVKVVRSLKILFDEIVSEDLEIPEVERYLKFVKFLTKYFFILNQVLIGVYNFIPLVFMAFVWWAHGVVVLLLPFDVLLPFSCDTWIPWLGVYIHSVIAAVTSVVYLVAMDTLYCVLTTHVCVNFSVLSYKVARLKPKNSGYLKQIVERHQHLIELSQDLETIFAPTMLLNFVSSSIDICLLGFNIVAGDKAHLPPFLLFLTSALIQIFLLSMFGDLIITESERVGQAAYSCDWVDMGRADKINIIILRERTRRPLQLTAMKFTPISYGSFSKIISTSWSYFTILNTVYSPPAVE